MTRVLFISSVVDGGSPRSQRALAHGLIERGHDIAFVVDDQRPAALSRAVGEQLADASVRFDRVAALQALAAVPGSRPPLRNIDDLAHWTSPHPHNALPQVIDEFAPDVVVGNSIDRHSWRRTLEICRTRHIFTVLYLREVPALRHLEIEPRPCDALVANSMTLAESARAQGHRCEFIPSVVDTSPTRTESTRETALLINPIASHGVDLTIEVARRCPEILFVFQESWPLEDDQWLRLSDRVAALGNVELRRRREPGPELYQSARVLLVPHHIDNRPRVIVEAQANAIPALISQYPGLHEAAGSGAIAIDENDTDQWVETLKSLWTDDVHYGDLVERTKVASQRPELDPDHVAMTFEQVLDSVQTIDLSSPSQIRSNTA